MPVILVAPRRSLITIIMNAFIFLAQILIPLGILNVWFIRSGRATAYRGANARNLKSEFLAYGLPTWMFYLIGTLKTVAATLILVGFVEPICVTLGASMMVALMLGAIVMHAKVRDPLIRYVPAALMFLLSLSLVAPLE